MCGCAGRRIRTSVPGPSALRGCTVCSGVAIRVKRGLWSYVRKHSDSFCLQLATDDDRAVAAMERAVEAIRSVPHPNEPDEPAASYVSEIELVRGGPVVMCDLKDLPDPVLRRVLDAVVAGLETAGIDGTLQPPPDGKDAPFWTVLADGHHVPPYPAGWALLVARRHDWQRVSLPHPWIEALTEWLLEDTGGGSVFWAAVSSVAFQLPANTLPGFLGRPSGSLGAAVGEVDDRLRHVQIDPYHVVISERGPSINGDALDRSATRLENLAREMAPEAAYLALDYPAARTRFGEHRFPVDRNHFRSSPRLSVPGAYPWQVLSRAHAEVLPALPAGAVWIDDDHVEVAFGDREAWMRPDTRADVEAAAEAVLDALLRDPPRDARPHEGDWTTRDDVCTLLASVPAAVSFTSRRCGSAYRPGAFVEIDLLGGEPPLVRLTPSHASGSGRLVTELVEALKGPRA